MQGPGGNLTFLFTDIEGSTRLWERHGPEMGRALAQHDRLVRAAVEVLQGVVFKTVGDAFCIVFGSAGHAVRAAVSVQQVLQAAAWGETGPLRVRMALHTGEAIQRDNDYFGPELNRVARLLAAGHGGQVLLSWVTAEMIRDQLPSDWSLRDLGERRLKDLSRPEHVFQLMVPDLPVDFPPLRSLEVLPNNLPAQVTSFVGREQDLAETKRRLLATRLLTLTGAGGTGKTRLSLQAAAELLEQFPHGIWLVEFAIVSDPGLVPTLIANAVDVREEHGRSLLETLADALRQRQLLLVLDNCEHLVVACAQTVALLLRRCPHLKVLASSREALNIDGETIQRVAPLPVPEMIRDQPELSFEQMAGLAAVQLFAERAAAVRPGFTLSRENASLVARICWRLDGIPLAIELAAARTKVLSLEQILSRLDDRFRLLSAGSRASLPRQQTLGALIDWSYDLLSEPERILLRRLAVFIAGRTLEMAEEVCAGEGLHRAEVFDLLSALVEKSLLMIEAGPGGQTRYTMLESVWDYADEKLIQHGESQRYRRKHLDYFVRLAETAEPALSGPDQRSWLESLSSEHHNWNVALRFSAENSETIENGLRLAGAIARYWEVHNYLTEGYEHLQTLLGKAGQIPPAVRAKAELGAGRLAWSQDRDDVALRHYHRARALYEELGQFEMVGMVDAMIGFSERNDGNSQAARRHFESAKKAGETENSDRVLAMAVSGLGSLAADEGDFVTARAAKGQSLALYRALGDHWVVALVTGSLGRVCYAAGDHETARRLLLDSLTGGSELGNKWAVPYLLEALANIFAHEGEAPKAVRLYGASSAQREALALAFSATEQRSYQEALATLRQFVPPEDFQREWELGRSLTMAATMDLVNRS